MVKNFAGLTVAVFLVVCLATGMSLVNSIGTPTDIVYSSARKDTDKFSVLKEDNDQDDFRNYIVSTDGSIVYFKAHYFPNQGYAGTKGQNLIYLDNEDEADRISDTDISLIDQFIFQDQRSILFDGDVTINNKAQKGLFKVDLTGKTIAPIKDESYDIISSIKTSDLFIGSTNDNLISVDKNLQLKTENGTSGVKYYFPLTFTGDYQGEISVVFQNGNDLKIGELDKSTLQVNNEKILTKDETAKDGEASLSFYVVDSNVTIAVTPEGKYFKLLEGKPSYQTTMMGKPIIGNKKDIYIVLNKKLQMIDDSVMSLLINEEIGFYVKTGKIFSFTISAGNTVETTIVYEGNDAVDVLTFNNGNIIFEACATMSKLCSVRRIDEKGKSFDLIVDNDNDDKGAWNFLLSPLKYSDYQFAVLAFAASSNPILFKFAVKPPVTCYGIKNTDSDVCRGNGECTAIDTCKCFGNFEGTKCEKCNPKFEGKYCNDLILPKCHGVPSNATNACGGIKRGECVSNDNCQCKAEYSGKDCEFTFCFGLSSSSEKVCGGKGICADYNQCKCEDRYSGGMCEFYENALVSDRALYPIMITYGVISLITLVGLLMLVFCFLGRHRKEHLALYGNRSIISHHDPINGEEDEELDEPHFMEREHQDEPMSQKKPQNLEYALDESDEDLEEH